MPSTIEQGGRHCVAIAGAGPAGLAAAEVLAPHADVHVFEAKSSPGRKFLLAGRSGLNLSRAEDLPGFLEKYGSARDFLSSALLAFPPEAVQDWAHSLGIETFVGSSDRIYPVNMKASPLLRAWIARLAEAGVQIHTRHTWRGWDSVGALRFQTASGVRVFSADATILTFGGGSWSRLGSDGAWVSLLADRDIHIHPLRPSNCGFDVSWSAHFSERFAGQPVQSVQLTCGDRTRRGDFVITRTGLEGNAVYALSAQLRNRIEAEGQVRMLIDLSPDRSGERLLVDLSRSRGKSSLSNHLRRSAGLSAVKVALLRECLPGETLTDPSQLARLIKALPLTLQRARPLDEAISSAGGIALEELDERFMLRKMPGVFAAGEMLDWEAPTGGYLLNACFATGRAAGLGALEWIRRG